MNLAKIQEELTLVEAQIKSQEPQTMKELKSTWDRLLELEQTLQASPELNPSEVKKVLNKYQQVQDFLCLGEFLNEHSSQKLKDFWNDMEESLKAIWQNYETQNWFESKVQQQLQEELKRYNHRTEDIPQERAELNSKIETTRIQCEILGQFHKLLHSTSRLEQSPWLKD